MSHPMQDKAGWTKADYDEKGQWENWLRLLLTANAIRYKYPGKFLPKPGEAINVEEAERRMEKLEKEWTVEWATRGTSDQKPCPKFTKLPLEAKLWLHSVLERVPSKETYNYNDYYEYG